MENCGYFSAKAEKFRIDPVAANSVRHNIITLILNYNKHAKKVANTVRRYKNLFKEIIFTKNNFNRIVNCP